VPLSGVERESGAWAWAEAYLCTKWHLDPSSHLATIDMGQKLGDRALLGDLDPHLTVLTGQRPTSVISGILLHPAIWLQ